MSVFSGFLIGLLGCASVWGATVSISRSNEFVVVESSVSERGIYSLATQSVV